MKIHRSVCLFIVISAIAVPKLFGQTSSLKFNDRKPQQYRLEARASVIDRRVKAHPEIDFLIDTAKGQPADAKGRTD